MFSFRLPSVISWMTKATSEESCCSNLDSGSRLGTPDNLTPDGQLRRSRSLRERTGIESRLEKLTLSHCLSLPGTQTQVQSENCDKSRPVRKVDFPEHMKLMSADSDFRFSVEYQELRHIGKNQSCMAADLDVNRDKNRFGNVLPFDHSRVRLRGRFDDGSDYINANFIPGENHKQEYIATQGPLRSTLEDFWTMVWEQEARAIVNLARSLEKGKEKYHQYWPKPDQPLQIGPFMISLETQSVYADWTVRGLWVVREASETRTVWLFHFTAWPDFGVPDRPDSLFAFAQVFRAHIPLNPQDQRPTVVHCSAGIGRSGTFISLDRLLHSICQSDTIDIFGLVHQLRLARISMVQTEQQYAFIHYCAVCVLEEEQRGEERRRRKDLGEEAEEATALLKKFGAPPRVLIHSCSDMRFDFSVEPMHTD